jgi:alpha-galactosidase
MSNRIRRLFVKLRTAILILHLLAAPVFINAKQRDVLTQPSSPKARVNGSEIYGVRTGHPFLYRIPATGNRPLKFYARNLPHKLKLDRQTGIISGKVEQKGAYEVTLGARNALGRSEKKFRIIAGDQIALTPLMGWSTWYMAYTNISDSMVRAQTDAMISTGLVNHGYSYIDIDDGWNLKPPTKSTDRASRDAQGNLVPGKSFPDMKQLTDYIHGRGLKAGIYISPGPQTCGGYEGSYQHERQDAETFDKWGFDLLKYDLCSYEERFLSGPKDLGVRKPYQQMGEILKGLNRDFLYSMCQYGHADVWEWGREAGGNAWRTTDDLGEDSGGLWKNIVEFGFGQAGMEKWAGPGGWNDPDNLLLGRIMWKDKLIPTPLTHNEQYAHFTLWSILAAPLVIGGDLTTMDSFTLSLLSNDEVIALDQDILGNQGAPVYRSGNVEVWAKKLKGGVIAVGLFNRGENEAAVFARWSDLGIHGKRVLRDVWRQKDLGEFENEFHISVGEHGAELILLKPVAHQAIQNQ